MKKKIALQEIIEFLGNEVIDVLGDIKGVFIRHLKPSESVDEDTLDWINPAKADKQMIAENSKARVMLTGNDIKYTKAMRQRQKIAIIVENPKLAILKIGNHFFVKKRTPGIHKSATIHPEAKFGDNFFAGANVVVGNCFIGHDVTLHPNVVIHDGVIIGNHVTVKPGAILGFDGFGYERDENSNLVKFPQLGKLVIHDHVDIGSGCCIDRGSLSHTIIGFNSKINNLCRIAHNVKIGKNVILAGNVNVSGSTVIEDDVWVAPGVCFRGHQRIGKGSTLGIGAIVIKDVPPHETWVGNPARKMEK
jgi:UDP-3-O-[3-hydroxymyristoyl] glucosamine N-acyltransferase